MASFWGWLWEKIRTAFDEDGGMKLDRETVQAAIELIQARLEQEGRRRQVVDLRVEDLSDEQRQELYGELERLLRPIVHEQLAKKKQQRAR